VIAREGYTIVAIAAALALGLAIGAWQLEAWLWRGPLLALAVGSLAFTLYFFRDPTRTPPREARANGLVAPADGKVVEIVEETDSLYLDDAVRRVSIFLSPLDVHVNRVPVRGVVEYERYRPGDYLVAWHPKASEKNERSELGVRHPSGTKVLFKQIAGAVARRIEYHIREGDTVEVGQRFGIVKFGSRMDVVVPRHVDLTVENGDHVTAGETVMGWLPEADAEAASAATASSDTTTP
jgi:phosphatidylserine decarboxylase